jgi:hypothetical protein
MNKNKGLYHPLKSKTSRLTADFLNKTSIFKEIVGILNPRNPVGDLKVRGQHQKSGENLSWI